MPWLKEIIRIPANTLTHKKRAVMPRIQSSYGVIINGPKHKRAFVDTAGGGALTKITVEGKISTVQKAIAKFKEHFAK
jgi:hypothetical protein